MVTASGYVSFNREYDIDDIKRLLGARFTKTANLHTKLNLITYSSLYKTIGSNTNNGIIPSSCLDTSSILNKNLSFRKHDQSYYSK